MKSLFFRSIFRGRGISHQLTFPTRSVQRQPPEYLLNEKGVEPKFHVVMTLGLGA